MLCLSGQLVSSDPSFLASLNADVKHGFGDPGSDGFNRPVYEKALSAVQALLVRLR